MTKLNLTNVIRWILSAGLLYGVYTETGFFTTLSLLLILITFELKG